MDIDGGVCDQTITNPLEGNDASKIAVVAIDGPRPSYYSDSSESSTALRSQEDSRSSDSDSSMTSGSKVKFSITCQRGRLKSVVKRMAEAAMTESADLATEKVQVTLTLQLKG
ncbi:uncharacterized protein N7479_005909 [Penicillium vulpinum]|nr:uncharacterized protein N7479_005909 [Penicillium vulpinum]KAJ5958759.1 hypothetical protein N7479_005909 [Penicillium vulpinum]